MSNAVKTFLLICAIAGGLFAEETRREIVNPSPTPADDAKPNSDKVPDVYPIYGRLSRVVIFRFKNDVDLLAGMEKMIRQEKIKNAVILSAAGSLKGYHVHQISNRTFPSKNTFVKDPTAPCDLIGMNGYVINGRLHAHVTLAAPEKAFGGHLEAGSTVFTFAIVTVGILEDGIDLSKIDDKSYR
jgi:predicted DNA-binding protein with PD1-like motif